MKKNIWLITGVSSGLGKALAEQAMKEGHFVIATFRKDEQVREFNTIYSNNARAFRLDLSDLDLIVKVASQINKEFGKIDVLVNNAGVGFVGAVEEASIDEVKKVFNCNLFGTLKLTQAVLPLMRARKSGHIIQISSHGGIKAFAGFGIYNASKFALEGFSEAMAQEIAPLGIHMTIIEPGPFRTAFAGAGLQIANEQINDYSGTAGVFREKLKGVDGKQEGDPEKAARAIISMAALEQPPLRLALGKTALITIGKKLDDVKKDLETSREIARSVVFDS